MATAATMMVARRFSAVAAMVTGASTSSANGLVSPPVTAKSRASWHRSNSRVASASPSVRRLVSGNTVMKIRLTTTDSPTAAAQTPTGSTTSK